MTIEVWNTTNDYIEHLIEEFSETLDDEAEENEITDVCPVCLANEWFDKSNSLIMSELFVFAKSNPQAFIAACNRSRMMAAGLHTILGRLMSDGFKLFQEELEGTDENDCD